MAHLIQKFALVAVSSTLIAAASDTTYRDRGNRHEGKLRRPINAFNIQLLGALAEGTRSAESSVHETATLGFFPESVDGKMSITLQERFPKHQYRLDRVVAARPWQVKTLNTFSWPAADVLRPLGLGIEDLLPLVRIDQRDGAGERHVAPARWHATAGNEIERYRFVFIVGARAKTRHRLHTPTASEAPPSEYRTRGPREPFDVVWDARDQPEGTYRLQVEGRYLGDGVRFTRTIRFFHSPVW